MFREIERNNNTEVNLRGSVIDEKARFGIAYKNIIKAFYSILNSYKLSLNSVYHRISRVHIFPSYNSPANHKLGD